LCYKNSKEKIKEKSEISPPMSLIIVIIVMAVFVSASCFIYKYINGKKKEQVEKNKPEIKVIEEKK
jgi:flagellar basal body-associated protein FliL